MIEFHGRGILLDIEGTTSSIQYVHEVLFPFARQRMAEFLRTNWGDPGVAEACEQIARNAGAGSLQAWLSRHQPEGQDSDRSRGSARPEQPEAQARAIALVVNEVYRLMDADAKTTGLKTLQGLIWDRAFRAGELHSHLFDDVAPALRQWHSQGLDVRIYSSGSIAAQKAYFRNTPAGDLLSLFRGHYDTTIGGKRESGSYRRIAADMGLEPAHILFLSDVPAELDAAAAAGFATGLSIRPGNAPAPETCTHRRLHSFAEVSVAASRTA